MLLKVNLKFKSLSLSEHQVLSLYMKGLKIRLSTCLMNTLKLETFPRLISKRLRATARKFHIEGGRLLKNLVA